MLCRQALAQEESDPHAVQPERPTLATHAGTVAPAWVEVESGFEEDAQGSSRVASTPTTLKVGLAPRLQLGLVGIWIARSGQKPSGSGIGDFVLDVKWRVFQGLPFLGEVAVEPAIKFPTGSTTTGTGTGTTDAGAILISSHEFGAIALDLNFAAYWRSGSGSLAPKSYTYWTVSTGWPLVGPVGFAFEVYGYPGTGGPSGAPPTVSALAGPTWLIEKWIQVDAGVIAPVAGRVPRSLYAGVVWNIGRL